jgi:hypothetical protein
MDRFDFDDFLGRMAALDYPEILMQANSECGSIERISYGVKGCVRNRADGSVRYAERIKAFLWFMRTGTRPGSADDYEFQRYRIVAEALVKKGQFKPEVLDWFGRVAH